MNAISIVVQDVLRLCAAYLDSVRPRFGTFSQFRGAGTLGGGVGALEARVRWKVRAQVSRGHAKHTDCIDSQCRRCQGGLHMHELCNNELEETGRTERKLWLSY